MSNYVVSARKYRPATFDEVVGQEAIANTLENAINKNQLPQAMLFCGPRGVGKTTCARILAKRINEVHTGEIAEDKDFTFNIFELDAASNNSVDDIRQLIDQVRFPPQVGKYKVYIIDEVHMLTSSAFNAFLKTLEEPPAHAIFILATTEKHKIIPTILSRCQIYDFKRISVDAIKNHLVEISEKEGVSYEEDALITIAKKADGALRDALSIFDRLVNFSNGNLTIESVRETLNVLDYEVFMQFVNDCLQNNLSSVLLHFDKIIKQGFDAQLFVGGLGGHLRDLLVAKMPGTQDILEISNTAKAKYIEQAKMCSSSFLLNGIKICNEADINYKTSKNQRLTVELALMQLCSKENDNFRSQKKKLEILSPDEFKSVDPTPPLENSIQNNETELSNPTVKLAKEDSKEGSSSLINLDKIEIQSKVEQKELVEVATKPEVVEEELNVEQKQNIEAKVEVSAKDKDLNSIKSIPENLENKALDVHPNLDVPIINGESLNEPSPSYKKNKRPKRNGFSINSALNELNSVKEEIIVEKIEENLPEDKFKEEDLLNFWNDFSNKILSENPVIGHILQIATPTVSKNTLILEFTSKSSIEEFNNIKEGFLLKVRTHFNNYSIQTKCVETESDVKYILSAREQFDELVEKYPAIDDLRKAFDLDIDNPS